MHLSRSRPGPPCVAAPSAASRVHPPPHPRARCSLACPLVASAAATPRSACPRWLSPPRRHPTPPLPSSRTERWRLSTTPRPSSRSSTRCKTPSSNPSDLWSRRCQCAQPRPEVVIMAAAGREGVLVFLSPAKSLSETLTCRETRMRSGGRRADTSSRHRTRRARRRAMSFPCPLQMSRADSTWDTPCLSPCRYCENPQTVNPTPLGPDWGLAGIIPSHLAGTLENPRGIVTRIQKCVKHDVYFVLRMHCLVRDFGFGAFPCPSPYRDTCPQSKPKPSQFKP